MSVLISKNARLMATVCAHEDVKKTLLRNALQLTWDQLNHGESRDAFWSTCVAKVLNDPTWRPQFPLQEDVDDCDPTVFKEDKRQDPSCKNCTGRRSHPQDVLRCAMTGGAAPARMIPMYSYHLSHVDLVDNHARLPNVCL